MKPKLNNFHPSNRHGSGYDFQALQGACPELSNYLQTNPTGQLTIDFANPMAVKVFNQALLQKDYGIHGWDLPEGALCPPVPTRLIGRPTGV